MKAKGVLYIGLILLSNFVSAQDYAPLGAEWIYRAWHVSPYGTINIVRVTSDTIIDGKYCSKIQLYRNQELVQGSDLFFHEDQGLVSFYENGQFFPILDFSESVSVGDTIQYYLPENMNLYAIGSSGSGFPIVNPYLTKISKIDSVLSLEGEVLRRFYSEEILINEDEG